MIVKVYKAEENTKSETTPDFMKRHGFTSNLKITYEFRKRIDTTGIRNIYIRAADIRYIEEKIAPLPTVHGAYYMGPELTSFWLDEEEALYFLLDFNQWLIENINTISFSNRYIQKQRQFQYTRANNDLGYFSQWPIDVKRECIRRYLRSQSLPFNNNRIHYTTTKEKIGG